MAKKTNNKDVKGWGIFPHLEKNITDALQLLEDIDCDDAKRKLRETHKLVSGLNAYAISKSTPVSDLLSSVITETAALDFKQLFLEGKLIFSIHVDDQFAMTCSTAEVKLLQFIIQHMKAKSILEVGTYMGYAALGMAEAMAPGGKVTGIDIQPHFCQFVNGKARENNLNVEVKEGAAVDVLESLAKEGKTFDFIFIDCVKAEYKIYYKIIMDNNMLLPGGIIACDNVMQEGRTILRSDAQSKGMDDFNNIIVEDKRVTVVMIPCYDGLSLVQYAQCT